MRIYLIDQSLNLDSQLERLKNSKVMSYDKLKLPEKITTIELNTMKSLEELDLQFLMNYKIFPEHLMAYLTQWNFENRQMQVGDNIIQQAYLPPTKIFSQKIIFGVRISEIINEPARKGFSYETLEGHVEKGISTFTIEELNNKLIFKITTHSSTGNFLARLVGPIFSIPYQTFCTKKALLNVKKQIEIHG